MREVPFKPTPLELRDALNQLIRGRSNATGRVTLPTSGTSTVVTKANVSADSEVVLIPRNAAAATELGAGTCYAVASKGEFTITHSNSATSREFGYLVIGG